MSTDQQQAAEPARTTAVITQAPMDSARASDTPPLQASGQLRAALRGKPGLFVPLAVKLTQAMLARLYLRKCQYVGRYARAIGRPLVMNAGHMRIGDRVIIQSTTVRCELVAYPNALLEIGDRTWVGYGCSFAAHESIKIGSDCQFGPYTNVLDNTYHDVVNHHQKPPSRPVTIGDNVWVGTRAIILPGVSIGDGAVVGAGSVVTRDVPPRTVVAGNPARVLRTLE